MAVTDYVTKDELQAILTTVTESIGEVVGKHLAVLDTKIDALDTKMGKRFVALEQTMASQHKAQMDAYEDMKNWGRNPSH